MREFVCEEGTLLRYCGSDRSVVIPDSITIIGNQAFYNNNVVEEIIIPDSVTHIGYRAFSNCSRLKEVRISSNVETIQQYIFSGCISLEKVTLPGSIKALNYGTFKRCVSLRTVEMEEGIRRISEGAFCKCYSLPDICIPSTVKTICPYAFSKCQKLEHVVIHSADADISNVAFYKCPETLSITWNHKSTFPEEAEKGFDIDENSTLKAYFGTNKVVNVPFGVKAIGRWAFAERKDIVSVSLPETVNFIGYAAFAYTYGLESVSMPCIQKTDDDAFRVSGILEAYFPETFIEAGGDLFVHCDRLKKIVFNSRNILFKGRIAAMCDQLEEVIFPREQLSIPETAFYACKALTLPRTAIDSATYSSAAELFAALDAEDEDDVAD